MLYGVNFDVVSANATTGIVEKTDPVEAVKKATQLQTNDKDSAGQQKGAKDSVELSETAEKAKAGFKKETDLNEEEKKQVQDLKRTDQSIRAHEQAHKAAGGQYVRGGANYEYKKGPDGQMYAVGGEVKIDVSEVAGDPEATIQKMQTIKRAALAPQDPSPQDRRVASEASRKENRARAEMIAEKTEEATRNIQKKQDNPDGEEMPGVDIPGSEAAIFTLKDAESYRVDPPENLFELFA